MRIEALLAAKDGCSGPAALTPKCAIKNVVLDPIQTGISNAAGSVADSALDHFAKAVADGVGDAVKNLTTLWVKVPVPSLDQRGTAQWLTAHLWWYMSAAAVFSVMIAGARLAWQARGGEPLREGFKSLATLAFISVGGLAVVNTALAAGDAYSTWILAKAGGPNFGKRIMEMMAVLVHNQVGVILVIVLGLLVIVAALLQVLLMVARSAMLVVLAGMWPLSAAATNTEWGQRWFKKTSAWIVAFVLYKPAAATIYAAGIQMFGNEKGLLGALMGLTAMALALIAMPALMRLCVPMVGSLSEGAGGGTATALVGGAAGAGMAMRSMGSGPTGAVAVPSISGGGTGGGAGGGSGSSGGRSSGGPAGAGNAGGPAGPGQGPAAPARPTGATSSSGGGAAGGGAAAGGGGAAAGGAAAAAGPVGLGATAVLDAAGTVASGAKKLATDATSEGGDL